MKFPRYVLYGGLHKRRCLRKEKGMGHSGSTHLITHPSPMRQYRPSEITTACPGPVRLRSPRMMAPLAMIVFPPRMMFCGPEIVALRETLFPVSYTNSQQGRHTPRVSDTIHLPSQCTPPWCSKLAGPCTLQRSRSGSRASLEHPRRRRAARDCRQQPERACGGVRSLARSA